MPKNDPAKGNDDQIEKDEELDDEREEEVGDEDEDEDDDSLSLDELDAALRKSIEDEVGDEDEDEDEDEPADGKKKLDPEIEARFKKLEAENKALKQQRVKERLFAERKAAAMEVRAAARELRMTKEHIDRTILYFKRNPDLEGVLPFKEAALRANPSLAGGAKAPGSGRRNGARREEGAEVVIRGNAGQGGRPATFKPDKPKPGNYEDVSAFLRSSWVIGKLLKVTSD